MSAPVGRWMLVAAAVLVAGTLVAAFLAMDTPGQVREQRLDLRRVRDLMQLSAAIEAWQREHDALPASLEAVALQPGMALAVRDPVSGAGYGYEPGAGSKYRLCAVFATDTARSDPDRGRLEYYDGRWPHPAGRHCFDRVVEAPAKASVGP